MGNEASRMDERRWGERAPLSINLCNIIDTAPFGKTRRNGRGPSTTGLNPRPLGRWSSREERLRQSDTAAANSTIGGAQEKRGQENRLRRRAWILNGEGGTGGEQGDGGHRGPER